MKRPREFHCNKSSDSFCYICGLFTLIDQRRQLNRRVCELYKLYFDIEVSNQDKCWVPHIVCRTCHATLFNWAAGRGHMNFGRPMIWRDPIDHKTNCYVCVTKTFGFTRKNKQNIKYAKVDSVTFPIPHSDTLKVPASPGSDFQYDLDEENSSDSDDTNDDEDPLYIPDTKEPYMLSQGDLFDLVRDLNLSKEMSELLGSRLQQWHLLQQGMIHLISIKCVRMLEMYFVFRR